MLTLLSERTLMAYDYNKMPSDQLPGDQYAAVINHPVDTRPVIKALEPNVFCATCLLNMPGTTCFLAYFTVFSVYV